MSIYDFLKEILTLEHIPVHPLDGDSFLQAMGLLVEIVWKSRNDYVFKHVVHDASLASAVLLRKLTEFHKYLKDYASTKASYTFFDPTRPYVSSPWRWKPPPIEVVKVNVDVSICLGKCFVSLVARDYRGAILHLGVVQENIFNIKAAEAKVVVLTLSERWIAIVVESDVQAVVCRPNLPNSLHMSHWESL